jgi:hypothetical protein
MKAITEILTIVICLSLGFVLGYRAKKNQIEKIYPTDNELIEINDSTYYRINVRIDTTYFYDR